MLNIWIHLALAVRLCYLFMQADWVWRNKTENISWNKDFVVYQGFGRCCCHITSQVYAPCRGWWPIQGALWHKQKAKTQTTIDWPSTESGQGFSCSSIQLLLVALQTKTDSLQTVYIKNFLTWDLMRMFNIINGLILPHFMTSACLVKKNQQMTAWNILLGKYGLIFRIRLNTNFRRYRT